MRSVRAVAVVGLVAMTLLAPRVAGATPALVPPPGPSSAHGFLMAPASSAAAPGVTKPMTYFADGLNVWVNARADHAAKLARLARFAVAQLRANHVRIHYRGIARNRAAESGTRGTLGVVQVTTLPAQDRVCRRFAAGKPGLGVHVVYHAIAKYPGLNEIESADVNVCPSVLGVGSRNAIALHEFGHVVGLGNLRGRYRGRTQIMQVARSLPTRFGLGDRNGLRYVNYENRALARPVPPQGRLTSLAVHGATVHASGWAIGGRSSAAPALRLTVDGKPAKVAHLRPTRRPDVARRLHVLDRKSGFVLSAAAVSGQHSYCISVAAHGDTTRLGCASLTAAVAPPSTPPTSSAPSHPASNPPASAPVSASPPPPGASGNSTSSGTSIGLIAGGAGGVVVLALVVWLLVRNRRRVPAAAPPQPEPMQFWPTLPVQQPQPPAPHLGRPPVPPPADARPQHLPPPQVWAPQPPRPRPDDPPGDQPGPGRPG